MIWKEIRSNRVSDYGSGTSICNLRYLIIVETYVSGQSGDCANRGMRTPGVRSITD